MGLVVTKYVIEVSRLSYVFSKLAIYLLSGQWDQCHNGIVFAL